MSIRGKVAAAAAVAGVILLLSGCSSAPAAPTSDQIKASAQARLDASVESGRYARENLRATAKTPGDATCQAAWDNLLDSEQKGLLYGTWMHACADPATP
ncbi:MULTISPECIES: hypothetical protein [unclassified Streptomyces]|uniref:hypothetical protein n=1 Tax=unclassified Streptomyces TaxID=2593676 RepID=UPI003D8C0558